MNEDSVKQNKDVEGSKLGMWLFLFSEILLFGGLFVLYAVYFAKYKNDFIEGGKELDAVIGTANTVILIISSFFVAASITALRRGSRKLSISFVSITIILGLVFLINKYFEWGHKFEHKIYPGSEKLASGPAGQNIFFGLYYVITGLHGFHVVVGMTILLVALIFILKNKTTGDNYGFLENSGLYWHLVDLIWIFVFPLFYLVI